MQSTEKSVMEVPCEICGKINWKQRSECYFPCWDCGTPDCDGMIFSD